MIYQVININMSNTFKDFLKSMESSNNNIIGVLMEAYEYLFESSTSEYEYYKNILTKDSEFNELLNMVPKATSVKQRDLIIDSLKHIVESFTGKFDQSLVKILIEFFLTKNPTI